MKQLNPALVFQLEKEKTAGKNRKVNRAKKNALYGRFLFTGIEL